MPAAVAPPPGHEALDLVESDRMHREFTLPATETHDVLHVSYADVGRQPADPLLVTGSSSTAQPPTVLFIPGMFASRFIGLHLNAISEKLGVRVLVVDRPGMGRSTNVSLEQRFAVWVELVPKLLQHLGIQHVSLVSHSAGTMFLLNTLHHCRSILDPDRPFVAMLAPFTDPSHSKIPMLQAARLLPTSAFGVWNLLPKFSMLQAKPALAFSAPLFNALFSPSSTSPAATIQEANRQRLDAEYGIPALVQEELAERMMKAMFAEDTAGANSEALLCLKKGPKAAWGACDDYAVFARQLRRDERERVAEDGASPEQPVSRLRIRAYFAESDALVGKKGQEYVTNCFRGNGDGEGSSDVVDFEAVTVAGSDHDSIIGMVDVLEEIFVQAGGHMPSAAA